MRKSLSVCHLKNDVVPHIDFLQRKTHNAGLFLGSLNLILRVGSAVPIIGSSLRSCREIVMDIEDFNSKLDSAAIDAKRLVHSLLTINLMVEHRADLFSIEDSVVSEMFDDVQQAVSHTKLLLQTLRHSSRVSVFTSTCRVASMIRLIEKNTNIVENVVQHMKTMILMAPGNMVLQATKCKKKIVWRHAPLLPRTQSLPKMKTSFGGASTM